MDEHFVLRHSQRLLAGALTLIALVTWVMQGRVLARSFFGAWIFAGVLLLSLFLWVVFGRRKVHIRNGKLNVEADVLGLRFYRSAPLMISGTRNLRVEEYRLGYKGKTLTRYRLMAEFDGTQKKVLSDLSETQAHALVRWEPLANLLTGERSVPKQCGTLRKH